ncbi:MAG: hypothetical protein WCW66_02875 [Patescibacteria group bacterium]|jgi:hypothetical protein
MTKINKKILVNDKMQNTHYFLSEPTGRNFDPEFKPELTPKQMLELGIRQQKNLNCTDK